MSTRHTPRPSWLEGGEEAVAMAIEDGLLPAEKRAPTVDDLQRELLAICKGRDNFEEWARVTGQPVNERINEMRRIGNHDAVLQLRKQIHAINPDAALYFGWCPGEDRYRAAEEFFDLPRGSL